MTNATTKQRSRGLALVAIVGSVFALTLALGMVVGCAPQAAEPKSGEDTPAKEDPMATQVVDWSMESDCVTCHTTEAASMTDAKCPRTMEEMATITADNQEFKDEKGKVQNPHDYPSNEQHDTMNPTCTDCHNNHSENLQKDAMMWCAQCHHKGVFQCGTCHELRERAVS